VISSITAALFFLCSLLLVLWAADEEPFYGRPSVSDALLNVGFGSVLIVCWIIWAVAVLCFVVRGSISRFAALSLALPTICIFYLQIGVIGYINDLQVSYDMVNRPLFHSPTDVPAP
jgi:hypothetical protein